jgi:hypothetical protein
MVVDENSDDNKDKNQQNSSGKEKIPIVRMVSHITKLICGTEQEFHVRGTYNISLLNYLTGLKYYILSIRNNPIQP